ncbi:MAG TPA: hypothetical protein VF111_14220, partial [Thermoanaerobaculia bacterium]
MATKEKEQKKGGKKEQGGKGGQGAPREHAGAGLPVPPPRLKRYFEQTVRPRLKEQFGLANP